MSLYHMLPPLRKCNIEKSKCVFTENITFRFMSLLAIQCKRMCESKFMIITHERNVKVEENVSRVQHVIG